MNNVHMIVKRQTKLILEAYKFIGITVSNLELRLVEDNTQMFVEWRGFVHSDIQIYGRYPIISNESTHLAVIANYTMTVLTELEKKNVRSK